MRQTTGLVANLPELAGLNWAVPDLSTLSRRRYGLIVAIPYRPGTSALHLLVDRTEVKAGSEGEWFAKKHGPSRPGPWRKVHLGIDAATLEIRGIEIIGNRVGGAPILPELLAQIPADQSIGKVSADGACSTRPCHATIAPSSVCAVIWARKNTRPWLETTSASMRARLALGSFVTVERLPAV